ncbi:hypothetical protein ARMGADRAFT_116045 [Armillaria gallica]|uniref:Uncharacterized protein n=1 Tax=Armillaria gallica TaxID=47427 RepID=A0A2H3DRJ9_ARMGA|nr:hypothetical protein ARMGADRAFT_116045 [Armillaria gallica]
MSVAGWQHRLHKIILHVHHYDSCSIDCHIFIIRGLVRQIAAGREQRPSTAASFLLPLSILGTHEHGSRDKTVLACKNERTCSLTAYIARRGNGEAVPDEQMFGEVCRAGSKDNLSVSFQLGVMINWFAVFHVARIIHDVSIFSYSQRNH